MTDEQVALYLEEHEPSLQAAIISAVEAERGSRRAQSPALVQRLVERPIEKCRAIEDGRRVERASAQALCRRRRAGRASRRSPLFSLGPAYLRHALSALLLVSRSVEAAAPYRIEVTPGNATVPQGRRSDHHRAAARASTAEQAS